ncbi:hypothetical protein [Elizabethkingia sp. JS20170427COW]|uniref:hypothetical protein n=1 Tax=Elizabethkingia sp. JS20170427COW TaxID=2583851 RepID=UPI0011100BAD|nr:hypothetical protein [Elizabethkingia sp. JS20170427COW]QCX53375.1 hypothetical protein FGE20_06300 [Elizabethkingia sp. JS20170427COW]
MKYFKYLIGILPFALLFTACNQADDICTEGGTPKMKVKFRKDGKIYNPDTLYVDVLYANDTLHITPTPLIEPDSILIPLKVNGEGFTDILVKTREKGSVSKLKVSYKETSQYVSPGCGVRKIYDDVSASLLTPNPITSVQSNVTQIHDETRTALYFNF